MSRENVRKLADVLSSLDQVMLTTSDRAGQLVSRPMAVRVEDLDGSLNLFAPRDSRIAANVAARPEVNISHYGPTTSVSIAGNVRLTRNVHTVAKHWHRGLTPWLPDGPNGSVMLEVAIIEAKVWSYPAAAVTDVA